MNSGNAATGEASSPETSSMTTPGSIASIDSAWSTTPGASTTESGIGLLDGHAAMRWPRSMATETLSEPVAWITPARWSVAQILRLARAFLNAFHRSCTRAASSNR